jgi:benzoate membrane transport protein
MSSPHPIRRNLPAIGAAVRNIIIFITVISIPLAAARAMDLSAAKTSSWILTVYGLPALFSLILSAVYRQPLLLTGNIFMIIFINGLEGRIGYPELVGASILAGVVVLLIGILGLEERLAAWLPLPIMFGLLAGAVLPFLSNLFTALGDAPAVVGSTLLAYLLGRRLLGERVPPILPALVTGIAVAAVTGGFMPLAKAPFLALPEVTLPVFSLPALLTATPVFVVLITLQANLPSIRFLQSQAYDPPELVLDLISGIGTMLGSLLGPNGVSLSLPATSVVAGPGAGAPGIRHRAVYLAAGASLLIGLLAGVAAGLAAAIPSSLLLALAGLSLVNVLKNALKRATEGPLLLGPLFAFAIALSEISFLGFGSYFWSLVIGTGISLLLERDALRALRDKEKNQDAATTGEAEQSQD